MNTKRQRRLAPLALAIVAAISLAGCAGGGGREDLPDELPSTVVVPDGDVSNQVSKPDEGNWSFSVVVADAAAQKAALDEMLEEGWEIVDQNEGAEESVYALKREKQNASVKFTTIDGEPAVVYNVIDTEVAGESDDEKKDDEKESDK